MPRRARRRDGSRPDPRAALLAAGEELVASHGIEAIHSNQIARAAGLGVGTFYAHFPDKHALLAAVVLRAWEDLGRRLERAAPPTAAPPAEVRAMTQALVAYAHERPARIGLIARGLRGPASSGGTELALSLRPYERRLRLRQQRGELDPALDPALVARSWWSLVGGTLAWWAEDPTRAGAEPLAELLGRLHPLTALPPPRPGRPAAVGGWRSPAARPGGTGSGGPGHPGE